MINRKTLIGLAIVTFVLLAASAAMGQDFGEGNAFLYTLGDIVWFSLLACVVALVALSAAVLGRTAVRKNTRSRRA